MTIEELFAFLVATESRLGVDYLRFGCLFSDEGGELKYDFNGRSYTLPFDRLALLRLVLRAVVDVNELIACSYADTPELAAQWVLATGCATPSEAAARIAKLQAALLI